MDKKQCSSCGAAPHKCSCKNKEFTKAVIEIDNPEQITLMRRVVIPASMGDDTTVPPVVGKYHNVLLYYEANQKSYLYSSDGIPTQLVNGLTDYEAAINLPQINGNTLIGDKTGEELGLQDKLTAGDNITIEDNVISATDTTYGPATDTEIGLVKPGDGLEVDTDGTLSVIDHVFDTVADMAASTDLQNGDYAQTLGYSTVNDGGQAIYYITNTTDSNEWQETISSGLYATLIGPLSPENTGLSVDTLINNWNTKKELKFGVEKTYTITSTITITDVKTYDFHGSTIIYDGTNTTDVINIGYSHNTPGVVIRLYAGIRNLNIDCNSKANNGLHISGGKALKFENIFISNPLNYGLLADNSVGQNWELTLNGIHASATNASGQALSAIKITDVTDSNFSNLYPVNGSNCWLYSKTTWCTYTNIHGYKFPDTNDYTQTQGIDIHGNRNSFDHIIVDTADSIGITNAGQFNVISDIYLYVKAGGTGIKNTGSHSTYRFITVRKALAKIIDNPSIVSFLEVSGIATAKDNAANSYPLVDISLGDNKLPIKFVYDYSANVVTPVRTLLQAVKTITAPATSAEFDLPTMPSADYFVEVVPRTKAIPYYLTRTTTKVTLNIDAADLPTGDASFSIYVKPNN